jgi:hypothetical protein
MQGMKVVETDNFGGDYPYESLVICGLSQETADAIAGLINCERSGERSPRYWKVVAEDYVLDCKGPA